MTTMIKAIMLLLSINLLLYVAGVRVVGGDNENFVNQFVNTSAYEDGRLVVDSGLNNTMPSSFQESGGDFLDFIDSLGAIGSFILFIVNIVFTPLGLFVSAGLPADLVLLIGVPIMVSMLLGVAYFIRSGS